MDAQEKINPLDYGTRYVMFDAINQRHFNGELPRPEISFENLDRDRYGGTAAIFCPERYGEPTIILAWNEDKIEDLESYAISLAHEMVHYYNFLHGKEDFELHGTRQYHNKTFMDTAKEADLLDEDFLYAYCDEDGNILNPDDPWLSDMGYHDCIALPDIDYSIYDDDLTDR